MLLNEHKNTVKFCASVVSILMFRDVKKLNIETILCKSYYNYLNVTNICLLLSRKMWS